jgi:hypothetical protein
MRVAAALDRDEADGRHHAHPAGTRTWTPAAEAAGDRRHRLQAQLGGGDELLRR